MLYRLSEVRKDGLGQYTDIRPIDYDYKSERSARSAACRRSFKCPDYAYDIYRQDEGNPPRQIARYHKGVDLQANDDPLFAKRNRYDRLYGLSEYGRRAGI